jgi:hypothetical protein
MKTAVILPTWSRVKQAALCARRLLDTSLCDIVIVTEDDMREFGHLVDSRRVYFLLVAERPRLSAVMKWNYGLECMPDYDAYVLGADDLWAHDGWHEEALRVQRESGCGFVGINDGHSDGAQMSTHYMMTREFIVRHHGGVMAVPHYRSWAIDEEATIRARRANQFAYADRAVLEHRHWLWNKAENDLTYSSSNPAHDYDIAICRMRHAHGFPDDFEAVIS